MIIDFRRGNIEMCKNGLTNSLDWIEICTMYPRANLKTLFRSRYGSKEKTVQLHESVKRVTLL